MFKLLKIFQPQDVIALAQHYPNTSIQESYLVKIFTLTWSRKNILKKERQGYPKV
jgi:hypothetical protein